MKGLGFRGFRVHHRILANQIPKCSTELEVQERRPLPVRGEAIPALCHGAVPEAEMRVPGGVTLSCSMASPCVGVIKAPVLPHGVRNLGIP